MLKPLGDRIIVTAVPAEEMTAGGIVLPDSAREKPQEGDVIAVGPGSQQESGKKIPMDVKIGDRVIYGKYAGTEVKVGADEYVILRQDDVLAITEAKKPKTAKK
jgi:chaperonin GroES